MNMLSEECWFLFIEVLGFDSEEIQETMKEKPHLAKRLKKFCDGIEYKWKHDVPIEYSSDFRNIKKFDSELREEISEEGMNSFEDFIEYFVENPEKRIIDKIWDVERKRWKKVPDESLSKREKIRKWLIEEVEKQDPRRKGSSVWKAGCDNQFDENKSLKENRKKLKKFLETQFDLKFSKHD